MEDDSTVRVLDGTMEAVRHASSQGRDQRVDDLAHRRELAMERRGVNAVPVRQHLRVEVAERVALGSTKPAADYDGSYPKRADQDAYEDLLILGFVARQRNVFSQRVSTRAECTRAVGFGPRGAATAHFGEPLSRHSAVKFLATGAPEWTIAVHLPVPAKVPNPLVHRIEADRTLRSVSVVERDIASTDSA